MKPQITVARSSGLSALKQSLTGLNRIAAYVGIPSANAQDRSQTLQKLAGNISAKSVKGRKRRSRMLALATDQVNNAELLFVFSKGSPIRRQPPRPLLEPAIVAQGNKEAIDAELAQAARLMMQGKKPEAMQFMNRAAMAGRNAARNWFHDPRNNWAPNAPRTIKANGSDKPGIDTASMRNSITGLVKDE